MQAASSCLPLHVHQPFCDLEILAGLLAQTFEKCFVLTADARTASVLPTTTPARACSKQPTQCLVSVTYTLQFVGSEYERCRRLFMVLSGNDVITALLQH